MNAIINILGKDSYLGHKTTVPKKWIFQKSFEKNSLNPDTKMSLGTNTHIEPSLVYDL